MFFRQIFEPNLAQYAYLIGCQRTGEAIVIDPQRDIDRYVDIAREEDLSITAVTETHIHADFLSGSREFAERYNVRVYLSDEGDADWKYFWANDSDYDVKLVKDGDSFEVGNIELKVVHTPGHTPEHISFLVTDHGGGADEPMGIATGDFVFVGDLGRPDLLETAAGQVGVQEPSARRLYRSVQQFLDLPEYLQVWPGHGAGSACGKALGAVPESTVGYEKRFNASIQAMLEGEDAFVSAILDGQPEPPHYFARMKRDNKYGPAILGKLPSPRKWIARELEQIAGQSDVTIVDTRRDRSAFMQRHIAGSIYAPLDNTFPTVTGSYLEPEPQIFLVLDGEDDLQQAILDLIRIGLDNIVGYVLAETLDQLTAPAHTPEISISDLESRRQKSGCCVLDVRRLAEFETGHVPGAINIAHTRLMNRKDELSRDETYLVHCRSGARAAVAAAFLEHCGINVVYVNGPYASWAQNHEEEANKPVAA